tara:strand:- start:226 stop:801 length:576 start_codon:yes stop_codon:yes gene_type:complete
MLRILKLFLIITNVLSFNIIQNVQNIKYINNKKPYHVYMKYDPLKGYDQRLTIIPSFQATIVINNWINYLSENHYDSNNHPTFILKSIYDMKIFISINKIEKNSVIFAWCPDIDSYKSNIAYIISGKRVNNSLEIHRIAQSPYYTNILYINSKDAVKDIKNIVKLSPNISSVNYDELHKYDNRYLLAWIMY